MNRFKRDENSGAAVLADNEAVAEYLQKKETANTIDTLREEINRLRQDLLQLKSLLGTNEKQ